MSSGRLEMRLIFTVLIITICTFAIDAIVGFSMAIAEKSRMAATFLGLIYAVIILYTSIIIDSKMEDRKGD